MTTRERIMAQQRALSMVGIHWWPAKCPQCELYLPVESKSPSVHCPFCNSLMALQMKGPDEISRLKSAHMRGEEWRPKGGSRG